MRGQCGGVRRSFDGKRLVLDGSFPFRATDHAQLALLALRKELDALVAAFVADDPRRASLAPTAATLRSILALISTAESD